MCLSLLLPQALLAQWRSELARQPLALSEADACAVLGISPSPSGVVAEEDMRKAYRWVGACVLVRRVCVCAASGALHNSCARA
jgi:hypothetical protein